MTQRLKRGRSFYTPEEFLLHPLLSPKSLQRLPIGVTLRGKAGEGASPPPTAAKAEGALGLPSYSSILSVSSSVSLQS